MKPTKYIGDDEDLLFTEQEEEAIVWNKVVKYLARKLKNNNMFRIHLIRINDEQDSLEHINFLFSKVL